MDSGLTHASRIRVLIADDSFVMRQVLYDIIQSAPSLEVCGAAQNGVEALEKIRELQPDVVTLDLEMPLLNGIEVLKRIMDESPRPIIVVSSYAGQGADLTLEALSLGAFDCLPKYRAGLSFGPRRFRDELVAKIEAAAHSTFYKAEGHVGALGAVAQKADGHRSRVVPEIVAIGTSTGGPRALQEILPELPSDLRVGIIVVQHMPVGFTAPLAKRLDLISDINVREAEDGDTIEPGSVYIAPAGKHIGVQRLSSTRVIIVLSDDFPGVLHKPSVDLMMLSVAATFGRYACGIILTGMGCDGLQGMSAIGRAGGTTLGQDQATSTVYGMPRACAERGVLQEIAPLSQIPAEILKIVNYSPNRRENNFPGTNRDTLQGTLR
ncbi:MAG TPA: chemotaxis response regulator protein-glutamate methylesterase [Terriglobales bacterium]|nr:chemotaxis response regulator protein-glutamate methylesterase [Terriglobales bacterium]